MKIEYSWFHCFLLNARRLVDLRLHVREYLVCEGTYAVWYRFALLEARGSRRKYWRKMMEVAA